MFIDSEEDLCMKKMNDGNFQKVIINLYEYFIPDVGFLLTILERRVRDSSLVCANGVGGQRCVPLCIVNSSCTHI